MHPNAQLIQKFYTSFQTLDAKGMAACYHPNVVFTDPAFGRLEGNRARAMWAMLCGRATDLKITFDRVQADDRTGSAHWEAWYSFGKERRKVHNIIEAAFKFQDGLIIEHTDQFDAWRWSRMALGPVGVLLGWTPFVQGGIRKNALAGLEKYLANKP
ncbi:MAG TPA: nuclear transport factor 2 family protein [Anaerolineales bacterium]|nr:nuclear transport factor 2 family protein [Anaerolineales bacterium]